MNTLCEQMSRGGQPAWDTVLAAWTPLFPALAELAATPQDSEWHGEGNVAVHTGMVLEEMRRLLVREPTIDARDGFILQLAAIFHDIGKPRVTRTKEIQGQERIVSPRHAEAGRNYLCLRLMTLGLPPEVETAVLQLTALHHHPRRLVQDEAPPAQWRLLARQCAPELLYWLEQADLHGRVCPDLTEQLEIMDLFRLRCEELGLWGNSDPWGDWQAAIDHQFSSRSPVFREHALQAAIRDAESGRIQSVEEALARTWQLRDPAPRLTLLWGPSGSGKSHWVANHAQNARVVSLDALREEIAGKRADQSSNGQVMQAAKERLKALLNPKPGPGQGMDIVWDATNLRQDFRAPILQLGFDYGAHVRILALRTPIPTLLATNRKRPHPVPESVLYRQIDSLEWPGAEEAHWVETSRRPMTNG